MQQEIIVLSPITTIGWVLAGILISLILPVAVNTLKGAKINLESVSRQPTIFERIIVAWKQYNGEKYLTIFLAASFLAIALVLLLGLEFYTPRDATLAGFAWESLTNKLLGHQKPPEETSTS